MLWYKAWLETRVRFVTCLVVMTLFCSYSVLFRDTEAGPSASDTYYNSAVHNSDSQIVLWWLLAVVLLTMGGLLREKAVSAASFTLALPYSRTRLQAVRMAVSLIQAMALIVIPWTAVFAIGSIAGKTHSVPQALFHLALMAGGGLVLFAIGFLVSSLIEGEYTAPMVSFGIVTSFAFANDGPTFHHTHSPILFMLGVGRYNPGAGLLTGTVPWMQIAVYILVATLLLILSIEAIQARDF